MCSKRSFIRKYQAEIAIILYSTILVLVLLGLSYYFSTLRYELVQAQTQLAIVQQNNIVLRHRLSFTPAYLDSIACSQARRIAEHEKRINEIKTWIKPTHGIAIRTLPDTVYHSNADLDTIHGNYTLLPNSPAINAGIDAGLNTYHHNNPITRAYAYIDTSRVKPKHPWYKRLWLTGPH